jgi:hypothetical protein
MSLITSAIAANECSTVTTADEATDLEGEEFRLALQSMLLVVTGSDISMGSGDKAK